VEDKIVETKPKTSTEERAAIKKTEGKDDVKILEPESRTKVQPRMPSGQINVPPDLPKADLHIVRPTFLEKQRSVGGKASQMFETMKEKTGEAVNTLRDASGIGIHTIDSNLDQPLVIPVIEQKYSTKTKTTLEGINVEKRWVDGKKNVEVPIKYERIFVNNKEVGKGGIEETLTQIKDTILKIIPIEDAKKKDYDNSNWVPLLGPDTEAERTIPLYAEEIVISKRIVKVGDAIVRKRQVTELEKLDIDLITEKVTVKNPAGSSDEE
jgi:stress response protein YsnF